MSYEIKFYYTDPSTGNGNGNLCDWGLDHENLVQKDSLVITDMAWGPGFKPAMNTASMTLTWDAFLVSRLMHTLDNPDLFTGPNLTIKVVGESVFLFTGYLRPTGDLTYSEGGTIRLEAVDTTVKLESTYEGDYWGLTEGAGFKVLDSDISKSLVHKLLDFAGWSHAVVLPDAGTRTVKLWTGNAWATLPISTLGIEDKVRMYSLKRGDSIQEKLAALLFDYGYVFHAKGNGDLEFLTFEAPGSTVGVPEYSEESLPMIREFKVKKKDPKYRAVSVGYQTYKVSPSMTNTTMLNKTLYPEYRIHEWNNSDTRCWPPETNRAGEISNVLAFRTAKDAAGDSLGYEDVLEPWMDPGMRSASNWFFTPSHAIVRFKLQYKIDTSIFGIPTGEEEREDQYWFKVNPNGSTYSGYLETWKKDLVQSYMYSVSFEQNGLKLKLKRPATHPWGHNYAFIITAVEVYGGISYMYHSKESTNDVTAPRVRSGSVKESKLTKTYVSPNLIDPVRAKKLADAMYTDLAGNEITFKTRYKTHIGSVIRVRHIGKGFDAFARVTKVSYRPGVVNVFGITADTISVTNYVDPLLLDAYTAPGDDGGKQDLPESILSAISPDGHLLRPILGANLPAGIVPTTSGLYFLKEHIGFYIQGFGWRARISEDGSVKFTGKFTVGDGDHSIDFDPVTGIMKIRGELQVDGDSILKGRLRSDNFEAGVSGFSINHAGDGEFNNVTVRANLLKYGGTPVEADDVINMDYIDAISSVANVPDTLVKRDSQGGVAVGFATSSRAAISPTELVRKSEFDDKFSQVPTANKAVLLGANGILPIKGIQYMVDTTGFNGARTLDWNANETFTGVLMANSIITFVNPRRTTIRILVYHNNSNTYTITLPSARYVGSDNFLGKTFTLAGSSGSRMTLFTVFYDGQFFYVTEDKYHA